MGKRNVWAWAMAMPWDVYFSLALLPRAQQLEESQLALGSMLASRNIGPFREEVHACLAKLSGVSETLTLWMEVQSTWMYLEAVFAGGDIVKQLPQVHPVSPPTHACTAIFSVASQL